MDDRRRPDTGASLAERGGTGSGTTSGPHLTLLNTGPLLRRVRLWCGLILFTYVLTHLLNHALGNLSMAAMETMLLGQKWIWQSRLGGVTFYVALTTHLSLGLWALYARRHFRWTPAEATQLVLGFCIPPLLANHIAVTRVSLLLYGLDKGYAQELYSLWTASPLLGLLQVIVLIVAWTHGCIGLHLLFRLRAWYPCLLPLLLSAAVLLPVLALLGFVQGGREMERVLATPGWRASHLGRDRTGTPPEVAHLAWLRNAFLAADAGAVLLVFAARGVRRWRERRRGLIAIVYASGRSVRVPPGLSVLDASVLGRIAHASVCGGRGRCSTCRVRILATASDLPPAGIAERQVLASIGADPSQVRLACQLRPLADIGVSPLIPIGLARDLVAGLDARAPSEERFIVAMFVDMRGSTEIAERHLPFDSVFLIGRFLAAVVDAVVAAGGKPNQFMGDGVFALFGLEASPAQACMQSLAAVERITENLAQIAGLFAGHITGPIGFGIGVHCGQAVVGEIGFRRHQTFTALGDTVNIASRLQDLTRDCDCDAIISDEVFRIAGVAASRLPALNVKIRGRQAPLTVRLRQRDHLSRT